jgi:hypothetical protein
MPRNRCARRSTSVRLVVEATVQTNLTDVQIVYLVEKAAEVLHMKAYELDWAIWEYSRSRGGDGVS